MENSFFLLEFLINLGSSIHQAPLRSVSEFSRQKKNPHTLQALRTRLGGHISILRPTKIQFSPASVPRFSKKTTYSDSASNLEPFSVYESLVFALNVGHQSLDH